MKNKLLLFLSFLLALNIYAQGDLRPVVFDNLSIRSSRAYYQGNPFTGIGFTKVNGVTILEIIYRNGYKDGNHTERYANGKKKFDYQYSNGKMVDGEYNTWDAAGAVIKTETWSGGILSNEESSKFGKKNGVTKEYYSSGILKTEKNYLNDKIEGKVIMYREDKSINNEENYKNGKQINSISYDLNSHIIQKSEYDALGNLSSSTKYTYDNSGTVTSEMLYDSQNQLNGICYQKWDDGSIQWKRKYNHGTIEQTLEENKNDPTKSIKAVIKKRPDALIGVAKAVSANALNLDHVNIQIIYDLGNNLSNKDYFISYTNNWLFTHRLKYADSNSPESLDGIMTIKNYRYTSEYINAQNYGTIQIPAAYKVTVSVDIQAKNLHDMGTDFKTVSFPIKRFASLQETLDEANKEIGAKICDLLYTQFPIRCKVISIKDARNNGKAKTVIIDAGSEIGIYKKETMRVFDITDPTQAGGTIIAHLETTEDISADRTVCKVKDGEDKLTELINSGKTLKALFP